MRNVTENVAEECEEDIQDLSDDELIKIIGVDELWQINNQVIKRIGGKEFDEKLIKQASKEQKEYIINKFLYLNIKFNFLYKLITKSHENLEIDNNENVLKLWGNFLFKLGPSKASVILQKYGIRRAIQGMLERDLTKEAKENFSIEKSKILQYSLLYSSGFTMLLTHYILLNPAIAGAITFGAGLGGSAFVNLVSKEKHVNKLITKCEDILLKNKLSKGLGLDKINEGVNKLNQLIAKDNKLMKAVHNIINGNDALKKVKDIIGPILPTSLQVICTAISAMVVLTLATIVKHEFLLPKHKPNQLD